MEKETLSLINRRRRRLTRLAAAATVFFLRLGDIGGSHLTNREVERPDDTTQVPTIHRIYLGLMFKCSLNLMSKLEISLWRFWHKFISRYFDDA